MLNESKSISEMMPTEVKIWLSGLATQEDFTELRDDLMEYLDEVNDLTFEKRMENTHCVRCNQSGCRVELTDVFGGEKKMLCRECFDSI